MTEKKLRPVLDGKWKLIGPTPNLAGKIDGDEAHRVEFQKGKIREHNAPVDHHIVRDVDGRFHLWGCVRNTAVGRVLYHWETDDVTRSPWRDTGETTIDGKPTYAARILVHPEMKNGLILTESMDGFDDKPTVGIVTFGSLFK